MLILWSYLITMKPSYVSEGPSPRSWCPSCPDSCDTYPCVFRQAVIVVVHVFSLYSHLSLKITLRRRRHSPKITSVFPTFEPLQWMRDKNVFLRHFSFLFSVLLQRKKVNKSSRAAGSLSLSSVFASWLSRFERELQWWVVHLKHQGYQQVPHKFSLTLYFRFLQLSVGLRIFYFVKSGQQFSRYIWKKTLGAGAPHFPDW